MWLLQKYSMRLESQSCPVPNLTANLVPQVLDATASGGEFSMRPANSVSEPESTSSLMPVSENHVANLPKTASKDFALYRCTSTVGMH